MTSKRTERRIIILAILLAIVVLIGCSQTGETLGSEEPTPVVLSYNLHVQPETTDPGRAVSQPDFTVINAIMEGLTRYNIDGELEPAIAKNWEISENQLTYTFHLRQDAKWSNGDPVTAHDFEFAWKRALAPEYASNYAYQLYYITNGFQYNDQENMTVTNADEVGVRAVNDYVLEVTLIAPTPQFLGLTAFPTYFPVHRESLPDEFSWYAQVDDLVTNGPFRIEQWQEYQKITLVKNDTYWDQAEVGLDELVFTLVGDQGTSLTMYETGALDVCYNLPLQDLARLKDGEEFHVADDLSVSIYLFNTEVPPFDDVRVRRALAMAITREDIVQYVTGAGETPAYAYVPGGILDTAMKEDFRSVGGDYLSEDNTEAKRLLAEAGFPGGAEFPEITLLVNEAEDNIRLAQAVQEMWRKNLGITTIKVQSMEWRAYMQSIFTGAYDITGAAWSADYADPLSFLDVYVTGGGNNLTAYGNEEYDALIEEAILSRDNFERMYALHRAEEILMAELPIVPIFFYTKPYLMKPYVENVGVPSFGPQMEFKWAKVSK